MTWAKGQSGNPKGRVRHSVREAIRKAAARKMPDGETNAAHVAAVAWTLAKGGSLDAIKFVTEQVDGKVPTPLEHSGPDGEAIRVEFVTILPQPEVADG